MIYDKKGVFIFEISYINEIQILNEEFGNNLYQLMFPEFLISYNKVKFQDMKEAFRLHISKTGWETL